MHGVWNIASYIMKITRNSEWNNTNTIASAFLITVQMACGEAGKIEAQRVLEQLSYVCVY